MERCWLKNYPAGVPHDIDPHRYESVVQLLDEAFSKYGKRKGYVGLGKELSFGELDRMSRALGAWLQGRGLNKGDRVAIMMPNVLQYPVALAAVLRAELPKANVGKILRRELRDEAAKKGG